MQRPICILLLLTGISGILYAQAEKGVTPLATPNATPETQHPTRAVVVGISDYQSSDIPDLKFAHRDAEAFAAWLKSPGGGSVPADNIQLLTNHGATNAAFADALDWLLVACGEGDQAIIYFSGHGDVETKTLNQLGFLLLHDSPARSYKAGAYPLIYLQDIVSTLSVQNKARVTVVTDACHAGKLAGTSIGGPAATTHNLAKQFANEVKILSCQPNEFSLEGEQWGGGRGVFSWHLVDGLSGLADKNADNTVSLFEIGRYLEDAVPAETAPLPQLPMTVGDRQATLTRVDPAALAALRTDKERRKPILAVIGSRGMEDVFLADLAGADSLQYAEFKKALENRDLLDAPPGRRSADDLYRELSKSPNLAPLHNLMRRNLAVALQDAVQQALNALLDNDPYEANAWNFNPQKYSLYPAYLAHAIELLGTGHYMTRDLQAKQLFFEGYNLSKLAGELENEPQRRDSIREKAKALLLQSFALDGEAAYVPYVIGSLYFFIGQTDSVVTWHSRAIERAPSWLTPYLDVAYEVALSNSDFQGAETWIKRALEQDTMSYVVLERLAWLRQWQFRPEEANAICDKLITLKPDLFNAYSTKANTLYWLQGEYLESEKLCLRSLELNPNQYSWAYWTLGANYTQTRRAEIAVEHFRKGLSQNITVFEKGFLLTSLIVALVQLEQYAAAEKAILEATTSGFSAPHQTAAQSIAGRMWLQRGKLKKAETVLRHALTIDPSLCDVWVQINAHLGEVKKRQGKPTEAESFFKKAIVQEKIWADYPYREEAHLLYGNFLLSQNRVAEAQSQFEKCREYRPKGWRLPYGYALLAAYEGKTAAALDGLEQALERYLPRKEIVLEEPLFKKIRQTKRFRDLMATYFPSK